MVVMKGPSDSAAPPQLHREVTRCPYWSEEEHVRAMTDIVCQRRLALTETVPPREDVVGRVRLIERADRDQV